MREQGKDREQGRDKGLDRQSALVLVLGWVAALWITLT